MRWLWRILGVVVGLVALLAVAIALVPALWFFLDKTRWGLHLRAAGEHPEAAAAAGIGVLRYRWLGILGGGCLVGFGGSYLSLAYTPGVAEPCRVIYREPDKAFEYTARANLVAVVSNGTAVLGLGNIGAAAGKRASSAIAESRSTVLNPVVGRGSSMRAVQLLVLPGATLPNTSS